MTNPNPPFRIGIPDHGSNWEDLDGWLREDPNRRLVRDVVGHGRAWRRVETDDPRLANLLKMRFGRFFGSPPSA